MKNINYLALAVILTVTFGIGLLSSILSGDNLYQYSVMYQPPFSPPGWVFPIVWNILFLLMGISAYIVYSSNSETKKPALILYMIQLIFNFGWSILFFKFNTYWGSFLWLLVLWGLIYSTIKKFSSISQIAGKLLYPYLIWATFAGYLNLAIAIYYSS